MLTEILFLIAGISSLNVLQSSGALFGGKVTIMALAKTRGRGGWQCN
jgi:hypothetical protein